MAAAILRKPVDLEELIGLIAATLGRPDEWASGAQ
jgi:hypothetical protein